MNKKLMKFAAGLLVGFVCSSNVAFSQSNNSINVVTTAVPFLRISPDARAGGMGDVGISTAPDASSGFYNLSKVPFAKANSGIALNYTPWLRDITKDVYLVAASGYYKLDDEQAINMGVRYFNMGNIDFTDAMGNPIGSSRPREFGIDFGYTRKLTDRLSMGVALRYINSSLAKGITANGVSYKAGTSVAGDISLYNDLKDENGQGFAWGFAITNLGSKIGYTDNAITKEFIPANLGLGGSYTWVVEETSKFSLTADINKLLVPAAPVITGDSAVDNAAINDYHNIGIFSSWFKSFSNNAYSIALGAEFNYNDQFFARAGYYYETKEAGDRRYFTAGVGVKYNFIGLNFSYLAPSGNGVTRNPLSNTLRLGLTFDLDKQE
ncbi:type IX secretion system outer membrane channel protein PorV [Danxiaibacter flavus]|uniref:Type IX secretion system outer membrane channel protein PorV n=1 Tax=Danxiaibacter flavus TaxID=3049108 RepID=A0ABV3Z8A4_9BACT|nr:type IX secretion system outer membrane channel protein PorV [Chitinophagaceae bacterium DXS]